MEFVSFPRRGAACVAILSALTVTVTLTNAGGAVATPAGPFTGTTSASGQFQAGSSASFSAIRS